MFLQVSNYSWRPMEKTYSRVLVVFVFITSLCKSQDYEYDENYDYYNENYDYYNENYDDYSQELNDYYGHQNLKLLELQQRLHHLENLLAPAPPPPPLPPRTGNYILIMIRFMENNNYTYLLLQWM